ncbi:MAG TPA: M23 family metallopeptidase [Longimicrobiaceae bacterium]|nr:M23 family metallopeptidase [Longimicrobiaceae bacterium]
MHRDPRNPRVSVVPRSPQNPELPPRPRALRLAARCALLCGALALLAGPAQLDAQSRSAERERPRIVGRLLGTPKLEYLSRLTGLAIPVEGVSAASLRDSFLEGRSGGRTHEAIDIHAPRGTPVVAVSDGRIVKLHQGALGGNSIYHLDEDGRTRYYYAHLDRYAEGLREGQWVRRGEVIGYVGDTGNAQPGDFHLHFSVSLLNDARQWWRGTPLNPYALLTGKEVDGLN